MSRAITAADLALRVALLLAVVLAAFSFVRAMANAADDAPVSPQSVVESLHEQLLSAMKDARALGFKGRAEKLAPLVERSFDFPYISRLVLGQAWRTLDEPQRAQMAQALERLTVTNYAARFDGYDGERFETLESGQGKRGRFTGTRYVFVGRQAGGRLTPPHRGFGKSRRCSFFSGERNGAHRKEATALSRLPRVTLLRQVTKRGHSGQPVKWLYLGVGAHRMGRG